MKSSRWFLNSVSVALLTGLATLAAACDSSSTGQGENSPKKATPPGALPPKSGDPFACAGSIALGRWEGVDAFDQLIFNGDCSYSSSACNATGTVSKLEAASGATELTVTQTDAVEGCLPAGIHQCQYVITESSSGPTRADLSCDGRSTVSYEKL